MNDRAALGPSKHALVVTFVRPHAHTRIIIYTGATVAFACEDDVDWSAEDRWKLVLDDELVQLT